MILDTNAVSALLTGDPSLEGMLTGVSRHHLPTVVIGEYRYGLARSRLRDRLEELLTLLISDSNVLPIDLASTRQYAKVRNELRAQGTPIPENDVWIAALARQHGLPVVSRDEHFDHVPRLVRHGW